LKVNFSAVSFRDVAWFELNSQLLLVGLQIS
jgi:hypothetical protein